MSRKVSLNKPNDRQQSKRVALGVLIFVALAMLVFRWVPSSTQADAVMKKDSEMAEEFTPRRHIFISSIDLFGLQRDIFTWQYEGSADPEEFAAVDIAAIKSEASTVLHVEAIVLNKESYAVVNGRMCRIGDVIKGYLVSRIESRKILFVKCGVEVGIEL